LQVFVRDNNIEQALRVVKKKMAFLMVETGRAAAFVMDGILLYSLMAGSKAPGDYVISADALSVEPYGIMLPRDDAPFKKVVDQEMIATYPGGAINAIYDKFLKPIPSKGHQSQCSDERLVQEGDREPDRQRRSCGRLIRNQRSVISDQKRII
jgi:ABC-type amino acid transport substrate-binding protein